MDTKRLDLLNIGLMLVALALAHTYPYEVFLLAYAVLGPLHYLTEISWLHDRKNFCTRRMDAALLVVPGVIIMFGMGATLGTWHSPFIAAIASELIVFTFLSALVYLTVRSAWRRLLVFPAVVVLTFVYSFSTGSGDGYSNWRYWIGLYLPTLFHVFLFTAGFILLGALRNRSWTGIASLVVFVGCAITCFVSPLVGRVHGPGPWARANFEIFGPMNSGLVFLFGMHQSNSREILLPYHNIAELYASPAALKAAMFISFAYVYHYFNWFSKTRIIGWYRISRRRAAVIVALWLGSVGLYLWDYRSGLVWLAFLSLSHVTLEFPLNWLSFKECVVRGAGLVGIRRAADASSG